jgi:ABC-type dipeptide/oligopeptide/nickel transport system permease component
VQYLIRRLVLTIPVLLGVSLIVFSIMHVIPGDPVQVIFSGTGANLEQREAMRHALGLDRPLYIQYASYVFDAIQGNFGESVHFKQPVGELILERMPATIELTMASLFVAMIVAIPAGIIAGVKRNSIVDHIVMIAATLGISLPTFWVGIMMIMFVSVNLGWLPSFGRISYEVGLERVTGFYLVDSLLKWNIPAFKDAVAHLILPSLSLGLASATFTTRLMRSSMLEEIGKPYVNTARAKGIPERAVLTRHVVRNAFIPVLSIIGVMVGALLGGAIITETIFAWPGIGRLLIQSISTRDFPLVQGIILFFALIRISINLITDLLYVKVDPRIGHV